MGLPAVKKGLQVTDSEKGSADTFRFNVATDVVEENYDRAIKELRDFLKKDSEYPNLKERVERYVLHAIDLVNAIRAKRNFPGLKNLPMAKQEEINEKYVMHFNELQYVLKKIEKIRSEIKLNDIRSTVWVVKAFIMSAFFIAFAALTIDLTKGLAFTAVLVVDDTFMALTDALFSAIGL